MTLSHSVSQNEKKRMLFHNNNYKEVFFNKWQPAATGDVIPTAPAEHLQTGELPLVLIPPGPVRIRERRDPEDSKGRLQRALVLMRFPLHFFTFFFNLTSLVGFRKVV